MQRKILPEKMVVFGVREIHRNQNVLHSWDSRATPSRDLILHDGDVVCHATSDQGLTNVDLPYA
ncbi:MAG: hypothetical protein H0W53_04315 [Acidobacteria bacterium]|nr:hypothetical protein [Acidobacteriota bacterium]